MRRPDKEKFDSEVEQQINVLEDSGYTMPPNIRADAWNLTNLTSLTGSPIEYAVSAALLCIYRTSGCAPLSLREFARIMKYSRDWDMKHIYKVYKRLMWKSGRHKEKCMVRPSIYVEQGAKKLGFSKRQYGAALRLCHEVEKRRAHVGNNPIVGAAAILYLSAFCSWDAQLGCPSRNYKRFPQKEVADTMDVSEVALRLSAQNYAERLKTAYPELYRLLYLEGKEEKNPSLLEALKRKLL